MPEHFTHILPFRIFLQLDKRLLTELGQKYLRRQYGHIYHLEHFGEWLLVLFSAVFHFEGDYFLDPFGDGLSELFNCVYHNQRFHVLIEGGDQIIKIVHVLYRDVDLGDAF